MKSVQLETTKQTKLFTAWEAESLSQTEVLNRIIALVCLCGNGAEWLC